MWLQVVLGKLTGLSPGPDMSTGREVGKGGFVRGNYTLPNVRTLLSDRPFLSFLNVGRVE